MPTRTPDPTRRALLGGALAGMVLASRAGTLTRSATDVALYAGEALASYGFPPDHPFTVERQAVFLRAAAAEHLLAAVDIRPGRAATRAELLRFHTVAHVDAVAQAEAAGARVLDAGDTPVFSGIYAASSWVVGSALDGLDGVMRGDCTRTLQPIGGLHHARRERASGFCVFNDVGVLLATLRSVHDMARVAYVDIDVHHGDGVFYAFEDDPGVIIADVHQDGRTLYPGTGMASETGTGAAIGTKMNIELPPRAGDAEFMAAWPPIEAHLARFEPQFFVLQCGADGLAGDPLGSLRYTPAVHAHVTRRLRALASTHAAGRLMAFGGGGYDDGNLGRAWCAVLRELLD